MVRLLNVNLTKGDLMKIEPEPTSNEKSILVAYALFIFFDVAAYWVIGVMG